MTNKITFGGAEILAKKLLGKNCDRVERGRNNWVFQTKTSILTIPRHERVKDYKLRIKVTEILSSYGIPVASIIDYNEESENYPEYLIVEKINGEHANLETRTRKERDTIHESSGEVLKSIHQIQGNLYGRLDNELMGTKTDWSSFLDWFFYSSLKRVGDVPDLKVKYYDLLKHEFELTKGIAKDFSTPSLLHADFHNNNLLYKESRVSAVLDLDLVTSGNPNWDTGHYCHTFNQDRENGVKSFRKGYGKGIDSEQERLYCLAIWTRKIGSQGKNRKEALVETIPELIKILERKI